MDWFVKIFTELGYKVDLKSREFRFFPTHDVDSIHYWHNSSHFLRSFIGDTLKRKKPLLAMRNLYRYLKLIFNLGRDPFDTFDRIMDISEKYGFCSAFYFLGAGDTVYDQNYKVAEKEAQSIADNIRNRQHELGIHPCYKSSTNFNILQNQYEELNREFKIKVKEGRQHYLKVKVPETWRYWSELGLKVDSSMAFHDREGFRCGTCYEFPVFDVYKRQTLSLRERPLTIMECTLIDYRKMSLDEAMETIYKYIDIVSRYRGDFVFLWHNSSFESFPEYQAMYEKTLEYAYSKTNVVSE